MAEGSLSDKKRIRLQALEQRLSSSFSPAKKGSSSCSPLSRLHSSLKPNSATTAAAATSTVATGMMATTTITRTTTAAAAAAAAKAMTTPTTRTTTTTTGTGDFQGPAYAKLSGCTLDSPVANYLQLRMQLSTEENGKSIVDTIIRELVQDSGKVFRDLDGILDSKVQDRALLLDNPAGQGKAVERARRRATQSIAHRSSKHLSKRQQKLIGSFDLPLQYQKFDLFQPLHELWRAYAKESVNGTRGKMIEPSLLQLDLHGAYLAVVQAKIDNQVGIEGIMVRETTNTLAIITREDKIKVIPKQGSVFVFCLDDMCVTVYGDRMFSDKVVAKKS